MSSRNKRASNDQLDPDHEFNELVLKLHTLLEASSSRGNGREEKVAASKVMKDTCSYIKRLRKEVKDVGERLSQLLDSMENKGPDVDILENLLQQ